MKTIYKLEIGRKDDVFKYVIYTETVDKDGFTFVHKEQGSIISTIYISTKDAKGKSYDEVVALLKQGEIQKESEALANVCSNS